MAVDVVLATRRAARARDGVNLMEHAREVLAPEDILKRFASGPQAGIFTAGVVSEHDGAGGWAAVAVEGGMPQAICSGSAVNVPQRRLEIRAAIEGLKIPWTGGPTVLFTRNRELQAHLSDPGTSCRPPNGSSRWSPKDVALQYEARQVLGSSFPVDIRWIAARDGSQWNEFAEEVAWWGKRYRPNWARFEAILGPKASATPPFGDAAAEMAALPLGDLLADSN